MFIRWHCLFLQCCLLCCIAFSVVTVNIISVFLVFIFTSAATSWGRVAGWVVGAGIIATGVGIIWVCWISSSGIKVIIFVIRGDQLHVQLPVVLGLGSVWVWTGVVPWAGLGVWVASGCGRM